MEVAVTSAELHPILPPCLQPLVQSECSCLHMEQTRLPSSTISGLGDIAMKRQMHGNHIDFVMTLINPSHDSDQSCSQTAHLL